MNQPLTTLIDLGRNWANHDVSDTDRQALTELIDLAAADGEGSKAHEALDIVMGAPLTFGTAGLRGVLSPGQGAMNRATVIRATKGLIDWLHTHIDQAKVVIGCDARHGSSAFARDAAAVIAAAGGIPLVLDPKQPTPMTAFAVRHFDADAGIMVTASHNPPQDNGYKVYLGGRIITGAGQGAQLIAPADEQIHTLIQQAPPADEIARDYSTVHPVDVRRAYLDRAAELGARGNIGQAHKDNLTIVVTPMHGVGGATVVQALHRAGFTGVHLVTAQAYPDPNFPTVAFPNPEEPGALDCAIATANTVGADIIVALDPDADRCAVAVPDPTAATGYTQLTGDELGALLGEFVLSVTDHGGVANSIVSSQLLAAIATAQDRPATQTLTGFKWIARTPNIVFGYEEAIGYCVDPEYVRDKDGITAAITACLVAAWDKSRETTLLTHVAALRERYGMIVSAPLTFRVDDVSQISAAMQRLTQNPPAQLAGATVTETINLADGYGDLPPTSGLILHLESATSRDRVIIRPSGTEPKLKCYLDVHITDPESSDPRAAADARIAAIRADLYELIGIQQ
ncbi:phospho-sugar mutase [Corynebacterium choanae]|uniref:Putative phosphomannomutase n=1 Tax=Corynebacterium choanae TaxID=1862358 RepID=A0A3G6J3M1_9CORY|nr:phospho-sugar mutase [Corynebacterium choanae]AZA12665.1 putative phosphomannomutase [Corynebacterium choanae]